jgi:hypothetical protein
MKSKERRVRRKRINKEKRLLKELLNINLTDNIKKIEKHYPILCHVNNINSDNDYNNILNKIHKKYKKNIHSFNILSYDRYKYINNIETQFECYKNQKLQFDDIKFNNVLNFINIINNNEFYKDYQINVFPHGSFCINEDKQLKICNCYIIRHDIKNNTSHLYFNYDINITGSMDQRVYFEKIKEFNDRNIIIDDLNNVILEQLFNIINNYSKIFHIDTHTDFRNNKKYKFSIDRIGEPIHIDEIISIK